jgi:hypothetical protein
VSGDGAPVGEPRPAGAGIEGAQLPHRVVLLPLVRIGQHGVRLGDLLELLRGLRVVGIGVGMKLLGQPSVRLLDVRRVADSLTPRTL